MTRAIRFPALLSAAGCLAGLSACSGAGQNGADDASNAASAKRDTELTHEECDIADDDAVKVDSDNSGRPDIIRVLDGGREICRAVDINRDSLIDVYVYFDERGMERRREYGFDRDDRPDEIAIYANGQLVQKLRETNNNRKIDTWDYYEGGRLVKEERDSAGDGYVDQWWTFPDASKPMCAIVLSDVNGDGRPDAESKLDLCAQSELDFAPARPAKTTPPEDEPPKSPPDPPSTAEPTGQAPGRPPQLARATGRPGGLR